MQLVANIDANYQAKLDAFIGFPGSLIPLPITFLVDTGCSATCLLPDDVLRIGIDYPRMPDITKTIVTANGPVTLKQVTGVEIILPVRTGLFDREDMVNVKMPNLPFLPPSPSYRPLPGNLVFSLLGMDILQHFPKWTFSKSRLVMETVNQNLQELKESLRF